MYRHGAIDAYFGFGLDDDVTLRTDVDINTKDTYFAIFGPDQQDMIDGAIEAITKNNGVVLFRSKQSINFAYDDEPRNTLIIFEFNEVPV